ncbi:hypothetical protein AGLY_012645 [Aphis glycines]|uniref:Uncharacterized protein n=1 Tax=Aphis glycines TaxID=307491 RepID=A0A6G0T9A0_APHGL|nr:hypothetical protein AGLY_012645 [Aphis glycines]
MEYFYGLILDVINFNFKQSKNQLKFLICENKLKYICISSVYFLTTECSSLTVTLQSIYSIPLDWNSFSVYWYYHFHRDTTKSTTNDCATKSNKKGKENKNKLKFHCYDDGIMAITGLYAFTKSISHFDQWKPKSLLNATIISCKLKYVPVTNPNRPKSMVMMSIWSFQLKAPNPSSFHTTIWHMGGNIRAKNVLAMAPTNDMNSKYKTHVLFLFLHESGWEVKRETAFDIVAEPPESYKAHGQYDKRHNSHANVQHSHGRRKSIRRRTLTKLMPSKAYMAVPKNRGICDQWATAVLELRVGKSTKQYDRMIPRPMAIDMLAAVDKGAMNFKFLIMAHDIMGTKANIIFLKLIFRNEKNCFFSRHIPILYTIRIRPSSIFSLARPTFPNYNLHHTVLNYLSICIVLSLEIYYFHVFEVLNNYPQKVKLMMKIEILTPHGTYLFDGVGHEQYVHAAKSQLSYYDKYVDRGPEK